MPLRPGIGGIKRTPTKLIQGVNGVKTEVTEYWSSEGGVKKLVYKAVKGTPIENLPVGSVVKFNENGVPTDYIIVHKGKPSSIYSETCDGVWVLRRYIKTRSIFDDTSNMYSSSNVHYLCKTGFYDLIEESQRSVIKTVKIPHKFGSGQYGSYETGEDGLSTQAFLLSASEVGFTSYETGIPNYNNDGATLEFLRDPANRTALTSESGFSGIWWTRTPTITTDEAIACKTTGTVGLYAVSTQEYVRPAMIIDYTALVMDDGTITPQGEV